MPSPFPGMDPWLESPEIFPDLHASLIVYLQAAINAQLQTPYYAASLSRLWIEESDRYVESDVNILRPQRNGGAPGSQGNVAVADRTSTSPVLVKVCRDEMKESYLQIYAAPGNQRLITSIEVLSPSNKRPGAKGRELYLQKQQEILAAKVNLVEIDLLRAGLHTTAVPLGAAHGQAGPFDYHVSVHRFEQPDAYFVYPINLIMPLPKIDIPVHDGHPAVLVSLQELLNQCYDHGRYSLRVDYETNPQPSLSSDQATWAGEVLRSHAKT